MKKILALVLAVLMLTSVAFAAADQVWGEVTSDDDMVQLFYPGAKISVATDIMDFLWNEWDDSTGKTQSNSKYFDVKVTFSKGEDLVKDMYWDGDAYVVELKDYNEITDEDDDIVIKTVEVKLKKDSKNHFLRLKSGDVDSQHRDLMVFDAGRLNGEKSAEATWGETDATRGAIWDVGYDYWELDEDGEPTKFDDFNGKWKKDIDVFETGTNTPFYKNTTDDETLDISLGDMVQGSDVALDCDFSLKAGQWFMMTAYENGREDYEKMEDKFDEITEAAGAEYAYLWGFEGSTLKSKATFTLGADKDAFVYAIDKDGNVTESGFKWNDDDEVWKKTTRDLGGCYILSDVELATSAAADTTNPDTGANDVIGIASALAVVAVISAAAISLKK